MDEERKETPVGRFFHRYGYLVVTVAVMVVLLKGVFNLAYVPSGSMEPTLPTRSVFLGLRLPWLLGNPTPDQGDIMMFYSQEYQEVMVKRVIGLPGQTVSFADGVVLVDGRVLEEDYLPAGTETWPRQEGDSFTVPEGCVLLLGDHRNNSQDSRYWENPYMPLEALRAKALVDISLLPGNTWIGLRGLG